MLKSGVIKNEQIIKLKDNEIIYFLTNELDSLNDDEKTSYDMYKNSKFYLSDDTIIEYFVKFHNYIVVYNNKVFYAKVDDNFDRIGYIKEGFSLNKLSNMIYKDGKNKVDKSEIDIKIEEDAIMHGESEENDLSFWYPKTNNIGFKCPKTLITKFTDNEVNLIRCNNFRSLDKDDILDRIMKENSEVDLKNELFVRLGMGSNKFHFDSCHLTNIDELYPKLLSILEDMYFRLEWHDKINLVLREFIKTNYKRNTIYDGLALNTEFRVFYDFDKNEVLGIYNYWDKNTMLDNLKYPVDLINFADTTEEIEKDFNRLSPRLNDEVNSKMPNANLNGKWSIDFMYDGNEFVLIDMAHAECSYYYDKVLKKH
ncbi:MAG: hypothetical protein IJ565_03785 [Bacilli bacterium]|nr:hypothetical protein [Bacilli bacterium]